MEAEIKQTDVFRISDNVVSREIEDEIIIVPLLRGIGDSDDELFSLNETGRAIWEKLDGSLNVGEVTSRLKSEFHSKDEELEKDIIGFLGAVAEKKMVERV